MQYAEAGIDLLLLGLARGADAMPHFHENTMSQLCIHARNALFEAKHFAKYFQVHLVGGALPATASHQTDVVSAGT